MQFLYKIPGYILLLFGGFCLSWGGFVIRSFEEASVWQILLLRSFFFMIALIIFLAITYKKNTIKILKDAGLPAVIGGLVMSLSFIAISIYLTRYFENHGIWFSLMLFMILRALTLQFYFKKILRKF